MLIIDQEQFLKETKSEGFIPSSLEEVVMENNTYDTFRKPPSVPNIPKPIKALIGAISTETSQVETAEAFDVSLPTVHNAEQDNHKSIEVIESKDRIINRIKEEGLKKIEKCVDFLDISKATKNSELIMIATGVANVVEKLSPKEATKETPIQFIMYTPERQLRIDDHEIIDVDK